MRGILKIGWTTMFLTETDLCNSDFWYEITGYDIFWKENAKELSEQRIEKSLESFREIEKRLLAENKMTKVLIGGSPYEKLRN